MSISQNYPIVSPSLSLDFANTKVLDSRITFSRPTDAVYYDGQTVTKAEENLLKYSQEFDNAWWQKFSTGTVTANATTAPDGTTTADEFVVTSTTDNSIYSSAFNSLSGDFSGSINLKPSTGAQWVLFALTRGDGAVNGVRVWVDLINGVIGTSDALNSGRTGATLLSASVEVSTNGFYRVLLSGNFSETNLFSYTQIRLVDADASIDGSNQDGNSIFLWGAQLEARDTVTAYTPTTTQPITNYIPTLLTAPANTARFDHNPVTGESLGLLVEELRTNLIVRSEEFDNVAWVKTNATISPNTIVAPNSTLSMDKLVLNSGSTSGSVRQSVTGAPAFTNNAAAINLSTNAVTIITGFSSGVTVENVGNGVVRISATVSGYTGSVYAKKGEWEFLQLQIFNIASVGVLYIYPVQSLAGSTGDGYSGIYIWGAQLEAGAFPTSYIKTQASQVTRSADSASMTGANFSSFYNKAEGTVYADYVVAHTTSVGVWQLTQDGGNRMLGFDNSSGNARFLTFISGTAVVANLDFSTQSVGKSASAYKSGSYGASYNGASALTNSFSNVVPNVSTFQIGGATGGANALNGHIKKLSYYPQRLTNIQLQALTS